MDDTHTKLEEYAQEFTDFFNTLNPDIKFTAKGEEEDALS